MATRQLGSIEESKFYYKGWSSEEDEKEEAEDEKLLLSRATTPPPREDFDFDPFKTPPQSPEKMPDPFKTPSPYKTATAAMRALKVTPSRISPGSAEALYEGYRSTKRKGIAPEKRKTMQRNFGQEFSALLLKGEESDSPKGHQQSVAYARRFEWIDELLSEIHHSRGSSIILFDVEHIVIGQREEVDRVGKLSGKHFFTQQQFDTLVTRYIVSSQGIRVVTWKIEVTDIPKRSTIFPAGFSPESLISAFQGVEPLYRRGNRSLRIINHLCVELYHQDYILRSAFPPFYWEHLEVGRSYTIMVEKTYTSAEILDMVRTLNSEYGYPLCGPSPIEFYNAKTKMCVVEVASKVGLDVDKGIYFEVSKAMLVPYCLSQDDFEELIEVVT
jgi:hypothetical protein